jgi:hypothetical protein
MTRCAIPYCSAPAMARSTLCEVHHGRARRAGTASQYHRPQEPRPRPRVCWCGAHYYARGLCVRHYNAWYYRQAKEPA